MKLASAKIGGFLKSPDPGIRAALVYGPDAGLVRERAERIAAAICPDLADPFRIVELEAAELGESDARLNDEAASLSLVGGRRLIRVRGADDGAGKRLERFFKAPPPGDAFILVEAADLAPRSSLRRAFESAKEAAALACYLDGPREIAELAREVLGSRKIALKPEAGAFIAAHLGGDRQVSRRELEKLALYVGDGGTADESAALAVLADSAELSIDDVVYAAADGDPPQLERALNRAFGEGVAPVALIRAELKHFQRLHVAIAKQQAPPYLFFKLADRFKRQMQIWSPARAASAMASLNDAEVNAKTTGLPADTICREALMKIARVAASAARRPPNLGSI